MADRNTGEAPDDATSGRAAQQHDEAYKDTGGKAEPGLYPANAIADRDGGDITPDAADPHVEWDKRVQPERPDEQDIESEGT
ncbi:MAG TPA: hypothetical protein VIC34_12155 [Croceibacterium sp.]|jgi:hypothetical protein